MTRKITTPTTARTVMGDHDRYMSVYNRPYQGTYCDSLLTMSMLVLLSIPACHCLYVFLCLSSSCYYYTILGSFPSCPTFLMYVSVCMYCVGILYMLYDVVQAGSSLVTALGGIVTVTTGLPVCRDVTLIVCLPVRHTASLTVCICVCDCL